MRDTIKAEVEVIKKIGEKDSIKLNTIRTNLKGILRAIRGLSIPFLS